MKSYGSTLSNEANTSPSVTINNNGLPSYDEAIQRCPSLSESDNRNNLLQSSSTVIQMDGEYSTPLTSILNNIKVEKVDSGIQSKDDLLNKHANLLESFIQHYNKKPTLLLKIKGYHEVAFLETVYYYENEQRRSRIETRGNNVEDFNITIDLTEYICDEGMIHNPSLKDNEQKEELELAIDSYIKSNKYLKEFKIMKEVNWDYDKLTRALISKFYNQGYKGHVEIEYQFKNTIIKVWNDNKAVSLTYHPMAIGIITFILTVINLIAWPLYYFFTKNYADKLKSTFNMKVSSRVWFQENIDKIINDIPCLW